MTDHTREAGLTLVCLAALVGFSTSGASAGVQVAPAIELPGGRGRGGSPAPALYAQFCAGCHGPTLGGGLAASLVDDEWKHASDDAGLARVIAAGVPGTPMLPFKDLLDEQQIRQLVFYIRQQGAAAKEKPQLQIDPDGHVVKSSRQTVRLEAVVKGLETPWGIGFLPDARMLVTERPGRLRIVEKGQLLPPVTGTPVVWSRQDGGLLDVEVHPDYARTGWIYLAYSEAGTDGTTSMTAIVRGRIKNNAWIDEQVIYKATPDLFYAQNSHYGVRFLFDPQGHLFYTIGDRGHPAEAQDLSKPAGKIHRVNADGSVPKDNPFVGKAGVVPTIWSYGHRNPQGLAFDPATGQLWATEHGPMGGDELNRIERGGNYGWPLVSNGLEPGITRSEAEGMISPAAYWNPAIGPAGIAFAGDRYPGWRNHLLVAGLAGQQLRRVEIAGDRVVSQEIVFNQFGRVRDVVSGPDGYLYVAVNLPGQRLSDTTAGTVVRLVPVN